MRSPGELKADGPPNRPRSLDVEERALRGWRIVASCSGLCGVVGEGHVLGIWRARLLRVLSRRPRFDRSCTSPRRHQCRPGRWRDDDRDSCEPWLAWHYWMGCWRAPGSPESDLRRRGGSPSEPFSSFPIPMRREPWLPRIYNYAPLVRVLAGLSWRQHPHPCTLP